MAEETVGYGSWPSPLDATILAGGGIRFGGVETRGQEVWWLEGRPDEGGRSVLVKGGLGERPVDQLDEPWSVRTKLHEYGGRCFWLGADAAYFTNDDDQRIYRFIPGETPIVLTPEPKLPAGYRYADGVEHPDGSWTVCVREDHHVLSDVGEPTNELVAVATEPGAKVEVLATGADFYMAPRVSPDGRWMSWIQWDHPNMPWDATELLVAPIEGRALGEPTMVASGVNPSPDGVVGDSIHGAGWTADGELVFSSDRSGYWNLYRWSPHDETVIAATVIDLADVGGPAWNVGTQRWVELSDGRLMVVATTDAVDSVALVEDDGELSLVRTPAYTAFSSQLAATDTGLVAAGAGPDRMAEIVEIDPVGTVTVHRPAADLGIDPRWFSQPQPISFGDVDARAHAFFYPPTGLGVVGPADQLPPLIVVGHGGPTSHSSPALDLKIQFWTTRGFGVVDVNYRGSSGFGRAYRDALRGSWGVYDVEDCVAAARHLAATGRVDAERMAIRGGSAGGLTVMLALIHSDVFAAGTSLYGVADLSALATDTHKFESRYLDSMVGPYPEAADVYVERSPINHVEKLSTPMLIMQGLEDKVVPPSQAEAIVAALETNGVEHLYITFPDEGHGFRKASNLIRSFEEELGFYQRVLGIAGS